MKIPVPEKLTQQDIFNKIAEQEDKKNQLPKEIEENDNGILRVARNTIPLLNLKKQKLAKLGYNYIGELRVPRSNLVTRLLTASTHRCPVTRLLTGKTIAHEVTRTPA